ncbi:hypothetical protein Ddc_04968 [Ditylenchus destructor]|nr:hypothetical protein Ddc_04968 [Ditylenchus destructor]
MTDTTTAPSQPSQTIKRGLVKQVLSGDAIVLQGPPTSNGPPKELTVYLSNVTAPRLARRPVDDSSEASADEPYAWEAREWLRKKIVGKSVAFVRDFMASSGREHGRIYIGGTGIHDAENVAENGVAEGWLEVRTGKQADEYTQKLLESQEQAKSSKKGRWSADDPSKHVRNIKWNIEDPRSLVAQYKQSQVDAVVEQVRDANAIRLFLLPNFEYITIVLSGVKAPSVRAGTEGKPEEYGEEAKFFVETRLLQRDVKVVLESTSNQNFIGTILHPRGNIAEFLLKDGFAKVVEWSIASATGGPLPLREAERFAKERKLRLWRNYSGPVTTGKNSFSAKVVEILLGDSIIVEKDNGEQQKIFFSSLRPPRKEGGGPETGAVNRQFRPLYDIPFMFEAREYLRKRLIGKRVNVTIDYIQPKSDQFPEKTCGTVTVTNQNIAEQLIKKGLAKVVRHRQDDDNRSPNYDALIAAEAEAEKEKRGMYCDKSENPGTVRVQELTGERSKQFMPYLQRSSRPDAIVDFVASGSRLRVYVPKETCLITFLLGGISCPRPARVGPGGKMQGESEPFADEALNFTKSKCLQQDVKIEVESMDKVGGFIGYLFVTNEKGSLVNLSEALVEAGLASVHFTAEKSPYYHQLTSAEKAAKAARLGMWKNFVEEDDNENEKQKQAADVGERKLNLKKVLVTEFYPSMRFAVQMFDDGQTIESLMNNLQSDVSMVPLTTIKRGQLAAARYCDLWHRVRIESAKGDKVEVNYIDFGNRETLSPSDIFVLPTQYHAQPPAAKEFQLALVSAPNDTHYAEDTDETFKHLCNLHPHLYLNVEYKFGNVDNVTLYAEDAQGNPKRDIGRELIATGHALLAQRGEKRFQNLIADYSDAEKSARRSRLNIWQYGDFTGNEI